MDLQDALSRAVALHGKQQLAQAVRLYDEVLEHHPHHPDALYLRGTAAAQMGDFDAAIGFLTRAVEVAPEVAAFRNNLGIALRAFGRLGDAAAQFRDAVAMQPSYPEALVNLAETAYALGDRDEARGAYRQALGVQPGHGAALAGLGGVLVDDGDLVGAARVLSQAAETDATRYGYCGTCLLGADFERRTDPKALPALIDALPAVSGAFPDPKEDGGPVVMAACDGAYLRRFAMALALSVDRNAPGCRVHLHVFDTDGTSGVDTEALAGRLTDAKLTVTTETPAVAGPDYYANVRFVRMYQLQAAAAADVLCLDADSLVVGDLASALSALEPADVVAGLRADVPELSARIWASVVLCRDTPGGRRYLERLAAYIADRTVAGTLCWWLDQSAMHLTWRMLQLMGQPVTLAAVPATLQDEKFDPHSTLWTATGKGKADEAFLAAVDRVLRGEDPR